MWVSLAVSLLVVAVAPGVKGTVSYSMIHSEAEPFSTQLRAAQSVPALSRVR